MSLAWEINDGALARKWALAEHGIAHKNPFETRRPMSVPEGRKSCCRSFVFERPTFKQCCTAIITGLRNLQDQRSQRFSANELPRWFVRNLARSYDAATLNSWQDDFRVVVIQLPVEKCRGRLIADRARLTRCVRPD